MKIRRDVMRDINVAILIVFILLSFVVAMGVHDILCRPIVVGQFYNPTLRMIESVEYEVQGWASIVLIPAAFIQYLFAEAPIWITVLYLVSAVWVFTTFIAPRIMLKGE